MILVLAGTYHQAKQLAERRGWLPKNWRYVFNTHSLLGWSGYLALTGTYRDRKDWPDIADYLAARGASEREIAVTVSCMSCNRWLITPPYTVSKHLDTIEAHNVVLRKALAEFSKDVNCPHLVNVVFHGD